MSDDSWKAAGISHVALEVLEERQRQITEKGFTPEHDDQWTHGQLAGAAGSYALFSIFSDSTRAGLQFSVPEMWPWDDEWWKPKGRRRDLIRAAALIIAEVERIDRQDSSSGGEG